MIKCPCGNGDIFMYDMVVQKSVIEVQDGEVVPVETLDSWNLNYDGNKYECSECCRAFTDAEILALNPAGTRKI